MKRFATVLTAVLLVAAPVSAQTLSVLLPTITFPSGDVTSSTKGCAPAQNIQACVVQQ